VSKTRNLSDLLDANGDVKSTALDNVPASNDASALTTGTLDNARLATNVSVSGDLTVDTDSLYVDSTNNRVGIGTSSPSYRLHIDGNSTTNPQLWLKQNSNGTGGIRLTRQNGADVQNGDWQIDHSSQGLIFKHSPIANAISSPSWVSVLNIEGNNNGYDILPQDAVTTLGSASQRFDNGYFSGTVTANAFSGDGSALTNVPAGVSSVKTISYTAGSATYTPTSGTKFVTVYATGGGGGGGSAYSNYYENTRIAGGGGSGGTAIRTYNATELGSTASITVGSGGSGGSNGGNGGNGGNTSFNPAGTGTTIQGNGGTGGRGAISNDDDIETGDNGGSASGGNVNINGSQGGTGRYSKALNTFRYKHVSGQGAPSFWGGAGNYAFCNANTASATVSGGAGDKGGGGGGGLNNYQDYTNGGGGAGGTGLIVIMEYA
jgi:hypothetical protein